MNKFIMKLNQISFIMNPVKKTFQLSSYITIIRDDNIENFISFDSQTLGLL